MDYFYAIINVPSDSHQTRSLVSVVKGRVGSSGHLGGSITLLLPCLVSNQQAAVHGWKQGPDV